MKLNKQHHNAKLYKVLPILPELAGQSNTHHYIEYPFSCKLVAKKGGGEEQKKLRIFKSEQFITFVHNT